MEEFCFHFKTQKPYLAPKEFINALKSFETIFYNINTAVFDNSLKYKIVVLPSEHGSFKAKIGFFLSALALSIPISATEGFLKGLTGVDVSQYYEDAGHFVKDTIQGVYESTIKKLKEITPPEVNLDAAIKAKSNFYNVSLKSANIEAIGFNALNDFSIPKSDFVYHIIEKDIVRELEPEISVKTLIITRPFIVSGKSKKWDLKDKSTNKEAGYVLKDQDFRNRVLHGLNPLKESQHPDEIVARVEQEKELRNGEEKNKNLNILAVYSFNDKEIKPLPSGSLNYTHHDNKPIQAKFDW